MLEVKIEDEAIGIKKGACHREHMYLVYAIGVEESKKEKSEKSVSMPLTDFPDEWKR